MDPCQLGTCWSSIMPCIDCRLDSMGFCVLTRVPSVNTLTRDGKGYCTVRKGWAPWPPLLVVRSCHFCTITPASLRCANVRFLKNGTIVRLLQTHTIVRFLQKRTIARRILGFWSSSRTQNGHTVSLVACYLTTPHFLLFQSISKAPLASP